MLLFNIRYLFYFWHNYNISIILIVKFKKIKKIFLNKHTFLYDLFEKSIFSIFSILMGVEFQKKVPMKSLRQIFICY